MRKKKKDKFKGQWKKVNAEKRDLAAFQPTEERMETDVTEGRKGKPERTKQGIRPGRKRKNRETKERHIGRLGDKRKKGG